MRIHLNYRMRQAKMPSLIGEIAQLSFRRDHLLFLSIGWQVDRELEVIFKSSIWHRGLFLAAGFAIYSVISRQLNFR